jgi:hypothetical protein
VFDLHGVRIEPLSLDAGGDVDNGLASGLSGRHTDIDGNDELVCNDAAFAAKTRAGTRRQLQTIRDRGAPTADAIGITGENRASKPRLVDTRLT